MENPTQRRSKIAHEVSRQLENIARGVMLGGSMQYGQNYSVKEDSDIDLVSVVDSQNIDLVKSKKYFRRAIPARVINMFKEGGINFFWVTQNINDVETNVFFYETNNYVDFCLLKGGGLTGYISEKPKDIQKNKDFEGNDLNLNREVIPLGEGGYIYHKPVLANGKFWGGPPRMDYEYPLRILYEKENFFTELKEKVWGALIEQLVKEYGRNVDLSKASILNSNWIYQTRREKFPPKIMDYIKNKTEIELKRYLSKS